jgi:dienelactone hydrolase
MYLILNTSYKLFMFDLKMKNKSLAMLLIMFLLFSSMFCDPAMVFAMSNTNSAAQDAASPTASEAELQKALAKRSSDYVDQFIAGNFSNFYNEASEQLKQLITLDALTQGWNQVMLISGNPIKPISSTYTQQNGLDIISVAWECILYDVTIVFRYNSDQQVVGLNTMYTPKTPPKPQSTAKWKEVSVSVGKKNLPGMLTLPKGVKKPPVIILIQGSGSSDMNEAIGNAPLRPFEDIAHGLAERGIATLRYNKRSYQYPSVAVDSIEYEMLEDAKAAVKLLSTDKRIDTNQIYLLGHSLGGMMAPKITADNPKIKGFISMAGTLRSLLDVSMDQTEAIINAEPSLSLQQKKAYIAQNQAEINKIKNIKEDDGTIVAGIPASYWKSLNDIDSISIVKKLKVPMLILQGEEDFQVYADKDFKLWKTTLKNHKNVTYKLYPGLSHLFMTKQISKNGAPDISLYNAPNHVDKQVIKDIAAWVKSLKK